MSFGPFIGSLALGFLKGLTADEAAPFNTEMDFVGPVKEEFIYRGLPLWAAPGLPFGSTAVVFAADHIISDTKRHAFAGTQMTAPQVVARFGDVFLGALMYEKSFRSFGILGAIASHCGHNLACGLGSRLRNRQR